MICFWFFYYYYINSCDHHYWTNLRWRVLFEANTCKLLKSTCLFGVAVSTRWINWKPWNINVCNSKWARTGWNIWSWNVWVDCIFIVPILAYIITVLSTYIDGEDIRPDVWAWYWRNNNDIKMFQLRWRTKIKIIEKIRMTNDYFNRLRIKCAKLY